MRVVNCGECGAEFETRHGTKRFCAEKCRIKNTNRRHLPRRREWARKRYGTHPRYRAERIDSAARRKATLRKADELTIRRIACLLLQPCAYCQGSGGTVDHIIPLSKGGRHHWSNLLPCCLSCNSSKKDRDVLEFLGITPEQIASWSEGVCE